MSVCVYVYVCVCVCVWVCVCVCKVLTVLGKNELTSLSDEQIIHNFDQSLNNIGKTTLKFLLGFLPRRDHQNFYVYGVLVNPVT